MPRITAFQYDIARPTPNGKRWRFSNFHITLNTNQKVEDGDIPDLQKMNDRMSLNDEMQKFIVVRNGTWDDDVEDVDVTTVAEIGKTKRGQRAHVHQYYKITHNAWLRIDPVACQRVANDILTELGSRLRIHYTHVRWIPTTIEQYQQKGVEISDAPKRYFPKSGKRGLGTKYVKREK